MRKSFVGRLYYLIEYAPIWFLINVTRPIPLERRGNIVGAAFSKLVLWLKPIKKRAEASILTAFPDMNDADRSDLIAAAGRNFGKTVTEVLNPDSFFEKPPRIEMTGPGLEVFKDYVAKKSGIVVASAHLGQWEALRVCFRNMGCEPGAVYRKNNNPYYERRFKWAITYGGAKAYARGTPEVKDMVRDAKEGGVIVILADQRYRKGDLIPFFGKNAWTSTAPAGISLRLGVPLFTVYSIRHPWGIEVQFDEPIEPSSPEEMTLKVHESLERRIRDHPEQWYWFHQRWAEVDDEESLTPQQTAVEG
ncbi:MAG: hypothetical protein AAGJ34_00395 [Pseudomonadota bacterium]